MTLPIAPAIYFFLGKASLTHEATGDLVESVVDRPSPAVWSKLHDVLTSGSIPMPNLKQSDEVETT